MKQFKDKLIIGHATTFSDSELEKTKNQIISGQIDLSKFDHFSFNTTFHNFIHSNKNWQFDGLKDFEIDTCIGATQFIDNTIMKFGLENIQILENDYFYYTRLNPNKTWAQIGNLTPNTPMIISYPFSGYGDIHPQMNAILDECLSKNIDLYIDSAWTTSAKTLSFDFSHPCIKEIAFSLSKGFGLYWNRIGIRYRKHNYDDSIHIMNKFNMINRMPKLIGLYIMNKYPIDYLWQTYGELYFEVCKQFLLRPTQCIHMAKDFNSGKPIGTHEILTFLKENKMSN